MSICCFYMRILLIYACYLEPCSITNKLLEWKDILPSLEIVYGRTLFLKPLLGDIGDVKTKQTKLMKNTTNKIQLKSFLENTFSLVRQHSQNSSPRSDNIEIPDLPSKKRKFDKFTNLTKCPFGKRKQIFKAEIETK